MHVAVWCKNARPDLIPVKTDVAVLGAGMIGVCVALHLQKRGPMVPVF